jgi:hypothetical protein
MEAWLEISSSRNAWNSSVIYILATARIAYVTVLIIAITKAWQVTFLMFARNNL